jgi:hypothetical protein
MLPEETQTIRRTLVQAPQSGLVGGAYGQLALSAAGGEDYV